MLLIHTNLLALVLWIVASSAHWSVLISMIWISEFISDLPPSLASAELPSKLEAWVPVNADLSAIEHLQVEAVHGLLCLLSASILHKAEPARRLLLLVETHDQTDDVSLGLREELKQLSFVGEER